MVLKRVNNESWNGTSWTELNNMLTARGYLATGTGISHGCLSYWRVQLLAALAGATAIVNTESMEWDLSWTELGGDLNTARIRNVGTAGTTALAISLWRLL